MCNPILYTSDENQQLEIVQPRKGVDPHLVYLVVVLSSRKSGARTTIIVLQAAVGRSITQPTAQVDTGSQEVYIAD